MTLNVLSLFSGIGGLRRPELGLERAGMTTVGQVEIDPYCQQVLARHWPGVPRHDDVRTTVEWWRSEPRPRVDVVCGGFPCQPFSHAGFQLGMADERWGWPWMAAVIRGIRPRYVLVENVSALIRDGDAWAVVLGDLAACRFDAEWSVLRASDFGAPHSRERVYMLAYTAGVDGQSHDRVDEGREWGPPFTTGGLSGLAVSERRRAARQWLEREPRLDRLVDGSARNSHRLAAAGNAAVPQISEHIGRRVMTYESECAA